MGNSLWALKVARLVANKGQELKNGNGRSMYSVSRIPVSFYFCVGLNMHIKSLCTRGSVLKGHMHFSPRFNACHS